MKPLLDAHCIECHSGGNDLDLSHFPFSFKETSDQATIVDTMLAKLGAAPPQMPPGNRPKLTTSEVETIHEWREGGLAP